MATRSAVNSFASKLTKAEKKAIRKQIRQINNLRRHNAELANISVFPTPHLMIGNGGLMCGVDQTQIVNLFERFGKIERIMMLPGRSYSLITFQDADQSRKAVENLQGRVLDSPSEFPKAGVAFYLSYLTGVPDDDTIKSQVLPPGLILVDHFVTETEEETLINALGFSMKINEDEIEGTDDHQLRHRKVKHFGYEFLYGMNNVNKSKPLPGGIPSVCDALLGRIQEYVKFRPDQLTVTEYKPGQGIPPHVDTHSAFEDGIVSLSLGSQVTMEFRHPDGDHVPVVLPRRSLLIMTGESRYLWSHGITPRKFDIINTGETTPGERLTSDDTTEVSGTGMERHGNNERNKIGSGTALFERHTRVSLTLRKIRHSPCACAHPDRCDSQAHNSKAPSSSKIPESEAEALELEETHVHEVYEKIADHFSGTRHSPWPRIAEFLRELPVGSLVADVGCGNGKYLGINDSVFKTGSDRSLNLAAICAERGFPVIVCDIMSLPYRSAAFDVCICIAVLHHLSTTERRLAALRELVRIARPGGLVLVYVWALEQEATKVKGTKLEGSKSHASVQEKHLSTRDECHLKTKTKGHDVQGAQDNFEGTGNVTDDRIRNVKVNLSRNSFEQQDLFVPWRFSGRGINKVQCTKTGDHVYHRFYHVFQDGELEELCSHLDNVAVKHLYYEKGNWCILLEKVERKT